jgi:antiviral helicase SKI2
VRICDIRCLGLEANLGLEAVKFADYELSKLCSTWRSEIWDELDWERVKELQVRDILDKRQSQAVVAQSCQCLSCPQFLRHVSSKCSFLFSIIYSYLPFPPTFSAVADFQQFEMEHDEWQVKENISQLKRLMSDQNLQLLPDYEQRILVLKDLGFIDDECRVQLKGKVACEVGSSCFLGSGSTSHR